MRLIQGFFFILYEITNKRCVFYVVIKIESGGDFWQIKENHLLFFVCFVLFFLHIITKILTFSFSPSASPRAYPVPRLSFSSKPHTVVFFFFFFFWTNREAVLDEMSQCSWGAGHLPAAHSDGTDGSASRMLLGVNCAPRAKLKLTLSVKGSANHRSIGRSEKCTGDDSIAQDGSSV